MAEQAERMIISVPRFDNSEVKPGYSKTLIGRCLNPDKQVTKSFLHILPRIWKMEDKIVGAADLGDGRFQFDFNTEEDIVKVLSMEPFHFNHWMLSVMRWEPSTDETYPSSITFWIRIFGIPLHYWAIQTFQCIAEALGSCEEVEVNLGRIRVTLDGNKPLYSELDVVFEDGEGDEVTIQLRYERLYRYCTGCYSLCHEVDVCPNQENIDYDMENHSLSYRPVTYNRSSFMAAARMERKRNSLLYH